MVINEAKKWLLQIFHLNGTLNANTFTVELMWLLESTIGGYNVIHDNGGSHNITDVCNSMNDIFYFLFC